MQVNDRDVLVIFPTRDSTISRLMLTVKDRAKPVVERATRIVEHKSRYRGGGGGGEEAAC